MSSVATQTLPATSAAYVRDARRLRAQHRNDPARLYQSLQAISKQGPSSEKNLAVLDDRIPVRSGRAVEFATLVAAELESGILRYSARVELLAAATKLGIEKFEANLIIAAVQHRAPPPPKGTRIKSPPIRRSLLPVIAAVTTIQASIIAAVWWLVR